MEECRLEEVLQRHSIGATIFVPFVVERLRDPGQENGTTLVIRLRNIGMPGEIERTLRLAWDASSIPTQPLGVQERTVTEWAACGVACSLIATYTELQVRSVAAERDRFDYWVGSDEYECGLEVSGTMMANADDIEARHRSKVRQLLDNPYSVGGYVVVVSFATRQAIVSYHDFVEAQD